MMKYAKTYQTPIGMMTLIATDDAVEEIVFDDGITANGLENDVMKQASEELREYFHGERISFSFPIHIIGTPFQKKVWHALMEIPYGETVHIGRLRVKSAIRKHPELSVWQITATVCRSSSHVIG